MRDVARPTEMNRGVSDVLKFDIEVYRIFRTTNAIGSGTPASTGQSRHAGTSRTSSALKRVYMAIISFDSTGKGDRPPKKTSLNTSHITFDGHLLSVAVRKHPPTGKDTIVMVSSLTPRWTWHRWRVVMPPGVLLTVASLLSALLVGIVRR